VLASPPTHLVVTEAIIPTGCEDLHDIYDSIEEAEPYFPDGRFFAFRGNLTKENRAR